MHRQCSLKCRLFKFVHAFVTTTMYMLSDMVICKLFVTGCQHIPMGESGVRVTLSRLQIHNVASNSKCGVISRTAFI